MSDLAQTFYKLTNTGTPSELIENLTKDFASKLGWNPSYFTDARTGDFSNGHIVVEYGLENTAVLTFLTKPFEDLTRQNQKNLLSVSYNNLVDWHIPIDRNSVRLLFNRTSFPEQIISTRVLDRENLGDTLRSDAFEKLLNKRPSSNIPALDDALINTVSEWKRKIFSELSEQVENSQLSSLFNCIIFLRAIEDNQKRYAKIDRESRLLEQICIDNYESKNFSISLIIEKALESLGVNKVNNELISFEDINKFEDLSRSTVLYFLEDFYVHKNSNFYEYDFSIMSKHALSMIYEKYVSILQIDSNSQLSLFPVMPTEKVNKSYGAYYTPQYIARFFSKYLNNEYSFSSLQSLKIAEPAVGSGIFLRALLESIYESEYIDLNSGNLAANAFENVVGVDLDENGMLYKQQDYHFLCFTLCCLIVCLPS